MTQTNTPTVSTKRLYKRLLTYVKPYWFQFIISILCTIAYSGFTASITYLVKPIIDEGFISKDIAYIHWIPIIFIAIFVFRGVANFFSNYFMSYIGKSVVMTFRQQIFNKLLKLPASYYDNTTSGALLSSIIYNTAQVSNACTTAVAMAVQNIFLALSLLVVMCTISWQLTLVVVAVAPIFAFVMKKTNKKQRTGNTRIQDIMGDVTHVAEETIEGYKVVKTFGAQQYEMEKFKRITEQSRYREMKVVIEQGLNTPLIQLILAVAIAIILFLATSTLLKMNITAGGFAAMFAALISFLSPVKVLTRLNSVIQQGLAGAEAVFGLLDETEEIDTGTKELTRAQGNLSFKNVCLSYDRSPALVLKHLNLEIKAGESVALVGKSGAGKTSLVSLLARFYDRTEGDILLDGHSIYDLKLTALRDQLALVSQHVTLFNDTIAHNIAYGRLGSASPAEIEQAAIAAHAMEFIEKLPQGLQTRVGEDGLSLSGGQRQRIAIARAILKNAPILILDEATSALDTESERHIQAALETVMRNRTTLIIAHRLSTIEKVDKIVVMEQGQIVEVGSHHDLLEKKGIYTKLHRMQFAASAIESA